MVINKIKKVKKNSKNNFARKKTNNLRVRKAKIAPIPMRNSKHAEEQSMKMFLVAGLSIILIIILALFLFYQDDAVAGQAISITSSATCGSEGDLCLMDDDTGSTFETASGVIGDSFTVVVVGYTANEVYSTNLRISYPEGLELDSTTGVVATQSWEAESYTTSSELDASDPTATTNINYLDYSAFALSDLDDGDVETALELVELTFTISSTYASDGDTLTIGFEETTSDGENTGFFQLDGTANFYYAHNQHYEAVISVTAADELSLVVEEGATTDFIYGESGTVNIGVVASGGSETYTDMEVEISDSSGVISTINSGDNDISSDGITYTLLTDDEDNTWTFTMDYGEFVEGEYTLTFIVTDSNGDVASVNNNLIVLSSSGNNAPTIDLIDADADGISDTESTVTEGDSGILDIDITASDADSDTLTLSAEMKDSSGTISSLSEGDTDGIYSLSSNSGNSWLFSISDYSSLTEEIYTITFTVTDGTDTDSETYTLTVGVTGTSCNYAGGTSTTETDYVTDKEGVCSGYACYVDSICATSCTSDGHCDEDFYCSSDGACEVDDDLDGYTVSEDCDDDDSAIYQYLWLYIDVDGDGYGDEGIPGEEFCAGETYSGYSINYDDCDDSDATLTTDCSTDTDDTSGDDGTDSDDTDSDDTDSSNTDSEEITVTITDTSGGEVSVANFASDTIYDIEVTVTPTVSIDEHLLIVSVADSNGVVKSLIYQSMDELAAGDSESQSLSYTAASTESHSVTVFVWAGWANDGASTSLIDSVVVSS